MILKLILYTSLVRRLICKQMKPIYLFNILVGIMFLLGAHARGATVDVFTAASLQNALTVAASNGQDDLIRVGAGLYYLDSTLLYLAPASENKSLTILCTDGDAIIDAGSIYIGTMRGFMIGTTGTLAHVKLEGLTLRNGRIQSPDVGAGAFIYTRFGTVTLNRCTFQNNTANELFNSVNAAGAFLKVDNSPGSVVLRDCSFSNNFAKGIGGGVYITAGYDVSVNLVQNRFVTNSASLGGGGAFIYMSHGVLTMDNNLFTRNLNGNGGGGGGAYIRLYSDSSSVATLRNNILWGNTSENGIGGDVFFEDDYDGNSIGSTVTVHNCNFADIDFQIGNRVTQGANTNLNPSLTSDLHLRANSPSIDAGTNLAWMTGALDIDGQPRIFNAQADMGPDEAFVSAVSITVSSNIVTAWDTVTDAKCQLQRCTNLLSPQIWQNVGNVVTASSCRVMLTDTNGILPCGMYWLKWNRP